MKTNRRRAQGPEGYGQTITARLNLLPAGPRPGTPGKGETLQQADQTAPSSLADAAVDAARINTLFDRLPPWVVDTLSTEQKEALHKALAEPAWKLHPLNIRISVPFLNRRYYVTVVGGEEKRSLERRRHDRHRYPLRTVANVFFVLGIGTVFYAVALIVLAMGSAILEL